MDILSVCQAGMVPATAGCKPAGHTGYKPVFQHAYGTKAISPTNTDAAFQVVAWLR